MSLNSRKTNKKVENWGENAENGGAPSQIERQSDLEQPARAYADGVSQEIIRSEVNFLVLPFFALSRSEMHQRKKTEYTTSIVRGEARVEINWKVSANAEYGYPGPFDRKVHKAIEQIISEMPKPLENPIPIGSLYRIAKLLSLRWSGKIQHDIQQALQRVVTTSVESKGTYYHKDMNRWIERTFHLYDDVVFIGETLPGGKTADTNYLFLGRWYLDNINARYVKPLDYNYYRGLRSGVASRLYELLGVKFYGMGSFPFIRYRYSTLCQLLPTARQHYASQAKQKLEAAHQELAATAFLDRVEWLDIPGEPHDWYITYWPGARAREEINQFCRQLVPSSFSATLDHAGEAEFPFGESGEEANGVSSANGIAQRNRRTTPRKTLSGNKQELLKSLDELGVSPVIALELVQQFNAENIGNWIKLVAEDDSIQDRAAYLVKAIREGWQLPEAFRQKEATLAEIENQEQQRLLEKNCEICQGQGFYWIGDSKGVARCEHRGRRRKRIGKGDRLDAPGVWKRVLESLRNQTPGAAFDEWLKDTRLLGVDGNYALVAVASPQAIQWLERRIYQSMLKALREALGREVEVEFVVPKVVDAVGV